LDVVRILVTSLPTQFPCSVLFFSFLDNVCP